MIPLSLGHSCNTGLLGQRDSTLESRVLLGLGTSYLEMNSDFLLGGDTKLYTLVKVKSSASCPASLSCFSLLFSSPSSCLSFTSTLQLCPTSHQSPSVLPVSPLTLPEAAPSISDQQDILATFWALVF